MLLVALLLAMVGWAVAGFLWSRLRAQHDRPTRAVLVNKAGVPESIRTLRGAPPPTYTRPRGKSPAWIYERVGSAAVYQTSSE